MKLSTFWVVFYWGWVMSEIVLAIVKRTRRSTGQVQDRGSQVVLWIVIASSITACEWISRVMAPNIPGGSRWLLRTSLIVLAAGLAIRWVAIVTLGKSFSVNVAIQASQKVHRTGLYRCVRHPSYLGLLLVFFAIGLHSENWAGLSAALLPTTIALLYRIQVEESALTRALGDEYREYSKVTKRLIPGVY